MNIKLLITILLFFTITIVPIDTVHGQDPVSIKDCIEIFNSMLRKADRRSAMKYVLRIPVKARLNAITFKAHFIKSLEGREKIVQAFVDELNFAVRQGYLTEFQATKIVRDSKLSIIREYFTENGKVGFRLMSDNFIKTRLEKIKQHVLDSGLTEASKVNKAFHETHYLNLKYDEKTLEGLFKEIETAFTKTFSDGNAATTDSLVEYLHFLSYQDERDFILGLREMRAINLAKKQQGRLVKKFHDIRNKVSSFTHKEFVRAKKAALKKGKSENVAIRYATKISNGKARKLENLNYSCKTRKNTPQRKQAAKDFTRFSVGLGVVSSGGFYAFTHRDETKDSKWYGKLSFEMFMAISLSWVRAKIISSQNAQMDKIFTAYLGKNILNVNMQTYATDSVLKYGSTQTYAELFGVSEAEAKERIVEYFADNSKREAVDQLYEIMKEYKLDEKYATGIEKLNKAYEDGKLSEGEFNDDDIKDYLIQAMVQMEYDQTRGALKTGSHESDLYTFDRLWFVQATPRMMAVSFFIYRLLCLQKNTPIRAFAKAFAVASMEKILVDPVYFKLRKWATGI